jgi:hypothetical protein
VSTAKHVAPFRQGLDEHGFAYFCQIIIIVIDKRILISAFYKLNGLMKKNKIIFMQLNLDLIFVIYNVYLLLLSLLLSL